jgi:uncharacterized protein (DUF433 family)
MSERKKTSKKRAAEPAPIIAAFSEEDVSRLTGISKRQLRYWDSDRFFVPSLAYKDRSRPFSRLYSFRDVVSLKVLSELRNKSKVSLGHLKQVKTKLLRLGEDMWHKTTLQVLNKRVVFKNPDTDKLEDVVSGQRVLEIALKIIIGDMQKKVEDLRRREVAFIGKFERNRTRAQNQLVIAGTRIPVSSVKAFADAGYSVAQIRKEYPTLTESDILAAINLHAAA